MNQNENEFQLLANLDDADINLDELESKLEDELNNQMSELQILKEDHEKIEDPGTIGETIKNVVWEQFINQIGVVAGEDFIKENRGLTLNLRDSAHIQTTENFNHGILDDKGPILATHNPYINFEQRYNDWKNNFQKNEDGTIKMQYNNRTGNMEPVLRTKVKGREDDYNYNFDAREYIDKGRPQGSKSIHKDHTVSAYEITCDSEANAHLTRDEQAAFANDGKNLLDLDASANMSKGKDSVPVWLDSERNGERPAKRFDINEEELRERDNIAREEYEKRKKEGEQRSIDTGKQSQKEEAFRIGKDALRAVLMGLLAEFIKDVIRHLVAWFRSGEKTFNAFIDKLKDAVKSFFSNLKAKLLNAGNTLMTTIATAILGSIVNTIKKAWIFLKQGYKSVKDAVLFLKDPQNQDMPFSIKLLNVGKIIVAGLTAGGAILLGETIEKWLMTIPVFTIQIPLLGSLASLFGIFFGALISGIIGALALRMIDKAISNKQRRLNEQQQLDKKNEIIQTQDRAMVVSVAKVEITKAKTSVNINERHDAAAAIMKESIKEVNDAVGKSEDLHEETAKGLNEIYDMLNNPK